jgi:XapX domain-containing protein
MKTMFILYAVDLVVGGVYGMIRLKSPAPPLVALIGGLLGMVWGANGGTVPREDARFEKRECLVQVPLRREKAIRRSVSIKTGREKLCRSNCIRSIK